MGRLSVKKSLMPLLVFAAMLGQQLVCSADEGMWMINAVNAALEKKMQERGLLLSADEIYDADAPGASLADAVVSLDFGCTGSMISEQGLLITNHHCAYSDVHSISGPERNYLEDGFWAMRSSEERNIPGKKAWFLKKVIDVTAEVEAMTAEAEAQGKLLGFRRLSWLIEKRYAEATGLEAMLSSMWAGTKYYLSMYEVYSDVRLVAAPPVSIAAFGGDEDNWEWPQHKCDFALYRVYAAPDGSPADYSPDNVPMKPVSVLDISLDGYAPGDFTMVIGYPGSTDRYSSSTEVDFMQKVTLPISNALRKGQMDIIRGWMDADPDVRLKYSDLYFSLSNVQELNAGEEECFRRFRVAETKRALEDSLREWIAASEDRTAAWGGLMERLEQWYSAAGDIERNKTVFRETLVRGTRLARSCYRLNLLKNEVLKSRGITPRRVIDSLPPSAEETQCCSLYRFRGEDYDAVRLLLKDMESLDLRMERELFRYALEAYCRSFDASLTGPYQKELLSGFLSSAAPESAGGGSYGLSDAASAADFDRLCSSLWDSSFLTDPDRLRRFISEEHTLDEYLSDPFYRFMQDVKMADLNRMTPPGILSLKREYERALHAMLEDGGVMQYPDANSTMRITCGAVSTLEPRDGVLCSWRSTASGILEKHDPSAHDFALNDRHRALLESADWGRWGVDGDMYVDFLTDNDITGGNSGSPVLNAEGKLIGLAFDGNKESLAGSCLYVPGYSMCVCVDIRHVLWILDRYAGMDRILAELGY